MQSIYLPPGLVDAFGVGPALVNLRSEQALVHVLLTVVSDEAGLALADAGGDADATVLATAEANG